MSVIPISCSCKVHCLYKTVQPMKYCRKYDEYSGHLTDSRISTSISVISCSTWGGASASNQDWAGVQTITVVLGLHLRQMVWEHDSRAWLLGAIFLGLPGRGANEDKCTRWKWRVLSYGSGMYVKHIWRNKMRNCSKTKTRLTCDTE